MKKLSPKGTVMRVNLYNKNVNQSAPTGAGLAYITPDGNIWLDGHIYSVGESAYLYNDTFYREVPAKLIEKIEEYMEPHISMLIEVSEKIDRNAITAVRHDDLFDLTYKDYSARYRNIKGNDHSRYGEKIDKITSKHDPKAIHDAIINEKINSYRFEIGGILHLNEETNLTPAQTKAVLSYQKQGGRLGSTALKALGINHESLS